MGGRAAARPVRRRRGRQHDALRADVRRLRARSGGRRHGTPAGGAAVRVATHPARRAAALPPGAADHLRGPWRPGRNRGRQAAVVRLRIGGIAAVRRRAVPGARRPHSAGVGPRAGRLDARHRPAGKAHERWLPARRRTRLPALRLPLCRAGDHRGQRQPAARRSRHAGLRARHRPCAGGGRHRRPGGGTTLAARRRGSGTGCDAAQRGAAHRAGAAWVLSSTCDRRRTVCSRIGRRWRRS